ncbi:alpha/beta hydrolase [Micromonospora sp. PLK6-60]|uniref:alpha/beta hydrolase n=1 Tax=Micromonospora sp. PLK6-60 TaxID=2873383 RepID=UPI001CA793B7|nr:alpha/beta hydrolase [Micromonospora sp. PLK6-60]MBY8874525.1 alpha/beta hydrolase [Micromonospora sp. PLK6-60]
MRRIFNTVLSALVASALSLGGAVIIGPRESSAAPGASRSVAWHSCPEHEADQRLRCGSLTLPVDWARPDGPTFELALATRPAADPGDRIGTLIFHPGGPGLSGIDAVFDERYFNPEILRRFDIVGFDPRGVGRSNPVVCSANLLAERPPPVPTSKRAYDGLVRYNRALYEDCRQRTGPLTDHLDSVSVAHDVDAIRAALGESTITFYGVSYGSLTAQAYAENYPHRVRAMVLDSPMDHSQSARSFFVTHTAAAEDMFTQFASWCDRTPTCALHGRDVPALVTSLSARADNGDLGNYTRYGLTAELQFTSWLPANWPRLAERLTALDGGPVGPGTAATMPEVRPLADFAFCQDWKLDIRNFTDFSRLLEEAASAAPHLWVGAAGAESFGSCLGYPGRVRNPQHRLDVDTRRPVLVVAAQHDPATPRHWAATVTEQLGRGARLFTYQGWGHGVYRQHLSCPDAVVDRFVVDGRLPAPGTTCAAVDPRP